MQFLAVYIQRALQFLKETWPWLEFYILFSALIICLLLIALEYLEHRRLQKEKKVYLTIIPPAYEDRTPYATKQLFAAIHELSTTKSLLNIIVKRKNIISLEIVSKKELGIRYVICIPNTLKSIFKHKLEAYLPEVEIYEIDDYLKDVNHKQDKAIQILNVEQANHYAYPIEILEENSKYDPASYITNTMTKLNSGEMIAFQILLTPVKLSETKNIYNKLIKGKNLYLPKNIWSTLIKLIYQSVKFLLLLPISVVIGGTKVFINDGLNKNNLSFSTYPKTIKEQQLRNAMVQKLSEPLFQADISVMLLLKNQHEIKDRTDSLVSSLAVFARHSYQAMTIKNNFMSNLRLPIQLRKFNYRQPNLISNNKNILSISEVSEIYHFPNSSNTKTVNLIKSQSRILPSPVYMKTENKHDIIVGENNHHGIKTHLGLSMNDRDRHVYIIGGTGNGKTTMLLYKIIQDIYKGRGVAVIDPHGDLAETVLTYLPKNRINDVIYLNPDDISNPIGINILELPIGLSGDDLLRVNEIITESTISIMRKMFSDDDSGGHRIEYILRNTIQTALTIENATLFTIFKLLNDDNYRKKITKRLNDKDLISFWDNEISKAGSYQKVKMVAGITSKIGRFLFSPSAKRIFEQPKSSINFDEVLNEGKILICNFSKGLLGEDTSTLFGTTILTKIQLATLRRARIKQDTRNPYYLYVDEFQNFATTSFVQMLSEARKYKLALIMAEQSTSQQDKQRLVEIILANVGIVMAFRSGSPNDEKLLLPLFKPYLNEGDIAYLPAFNFYMRISSSSVLEPMSGTTILLNKVGSEDIATEAIKMSRKKYGRSKKRKSN